MDGLVRWQVEECSDQVKGKEEGERRDTPPERHQFIPIDEGHPSRPDVDEALPPPTHG